MSIIKFLDRRFPNPRGPQLVRKNPVAVVTGASSGIGREIAVRLAQRGHHVLAVARRGELLESLASAHPTIEPVVADLTDPGTAKQIVDRARALGHLDLLVCNAGKGHFAPFHAADLSAHQDLIDLNLSATIALVHQVLPVMQVRRAGGVIVVSSNLGVVPTPNMAVYAATKAFLLSWTHALRHENRHTGVRFMAVCPGPTGSGFSDAAGLGNQIEKTPGHTTAAQVAEQTLRAWDRGRDEVVPGVVMRAMTGALDLAPRRVGRQIMGKIFA